MEVQIQADSSMAISNSTKLRDAFINESKNVLGFIRKRVPTEADAEDLLQDVFYQLVQGFQIAEPIEHISAWLYKVAKNKIIDLYRKKKTLPLEAATGNRLSNDQDEAGTFDIADLLFDPDADSETEYFRSIFWDELDEALDDLPAKQKQVFVWHELEQRSFKEITEMTGEPQNTWISRKHLAVRALRERLQDLYFDIINN